MSAAQPMSLREIQAEQEAQRAITTGVLQPSANLSEDELFEMQLAQALAASLAAEPETASAAPVVPAGPVAATPPAPPASVLAMADATAPAPAATPTTSVWGKRPKSTVVAPTVPTATTTSPPTDAPALTPAEASMDEDLALAMALQAEEERRAAAAGTAAAPRPSRPAYRQPIRYSAADAWEGIEASEEDAAADALEDAAMKSTATTSLSDRMVTTLPRSSRSRLRTLNTGGETITKHDPIIAGRRNARELSRRFAAVGQLPKKQLIPNRVYTSLKQSLTRTQAKGQSGRGRVAQEAFAARDHLTHQTREAIFGLQGSGQLGEMGGIVKIGKDAAVFHGLGFTFTEDTKILVQPRQFGDVNEHGDVAVKVFKTTTGTFTKRKAYMATDHRFAGMTLQRQNPIKIVRMWAEKEMRNLCRLYKAGVPSPRPLVLRGTMVIMSLLCDVDRNPAPTLKALASTVKSRTVWRSLYFQVVGGIMRRMYQACSLIHADLSAFNLLAVEDETLPCGFRAYVIDTAQAVPTAAESAMEFLSKDIRNVTQFFNRRGVRVLSEANLMTVVSANGAELREFFEAMAEAEVGDAEGDLREELPVVEEPEEDAVEAGVVETKVEEAEAAVEEAEAALEEAKAALEEAEAAFEEATAEVEEAEAAVVEVVPADSTPEPTDTTAEAGAGSSEAEPPLELSSDDDAADEPEAEDLSWLEALTLSKFYRSLATAVYGMDEA